MSFTITDAFVAQYSANVQFLAQQTASRFRGTFYEQPIVGETAYLDQLAPTAARKKQVRGGDTPIMNTQHLRRRVSPYAWEWADLVERADQVALLANITSAYAQAGAYAMERAFDDEAIAAFFATAYTGHAGGTSVTWPNGNNESVPTAPAGTQIAVNDWTYGVGSGNAGLTISKLIYARTLLLAAEGDESEPLYLALPATKIADLLATTEATHADYAEVKALVRGTIDTFMGFNFIRTERLTKNGSSQWRLPAWRKSGMGMGLARGIEGRISERGDKSYATQVFADQVLGAARLEEAKLVEIICTT